MAADLSTATPPRTTETPPPPAAPAPRIIPGLGVASKAPKSAKRSKKKPTTNEAVIGSALTEVAPKLESLPEDLIARGGEPVGLGIGDINGGGTVVEDKKTSAVTTVQKRIKALSKKIQRITGYESSTEPLNPDQEKAITTKPALESAHKELQELLGVLEREEAEEEKRIERIKKEEEKRLEELVKKEREEVKKASNSDLTLLFQFLHLHYLFSRKRAPALNQTEPPIPSVVSKASQEEDFAVLTLFDQFANGPLMGGGGDAIQKLELLVQGSDEDVGNGVTYARIKEMIFQMMSPPVGEEEEETSGGGGAQLLPEPEAEINEGEDHGGAVDLNLEEEPAQTVPTHEHEDFAVVGNQGGSNGFNFMQPSDLAESKQEEVVEESNVIDPVIEEMDGSYIKIGEDEIVDPVPEPVEPPQTLDWSEEAGGELPSLDGLENKAVEPVAVEPVATESEGTVAPVGGDGRGRGGFRSRGGERGGYRGRGRGDRGGYRGQSGDGRGSFRGRTLAGGFRGLPRGAGNFGRADSNEGWREQQTGGGGPGSASGDEGVWETQGGPQNRGRGGFRGEGRGFRGSRSRGRGEGRGGFAPRAPPPAPPPAPPAETS